MIAGDRLGHLDQVALATERPAIDAHVFAGIGLRIHPRRGLDIGAAWFSRHAACVDRRGG